MAISREGALLGQYAFKGQPWVNVTAKAGINLDTLGYAFKGQPWYGIELPEPPVGDSNIKTIFGVAYASIKTINGIAIANVKTFNGLA